MKVLFVINGLGTGGAERSLAEMLPHIAEAGFQPTIALLHRRAEGVASDVIEQGQDVRFLRARSLPGRVVELRRLIHQLDPDIVHTTIFDSDICGRLAAVGHRCAVVTSVVNTSYDRVRLADPQVSRWKLRVAQGIDGWTARHLTDQFHAITSAVAESAVRTLGVDGDRVHVVPRGRDMARLGDPSPERRQMARANLGLALDVPVVLNVGRQEYQKGHSDLIKAFSTLLTRHPDAILLQAGRPGQSTPEIEQVIRDGDLQAQVRLLGHRDDVPELLAAADVFAFPSYYEGLGGSLIEAMALGVPIVTTRLPAILEVVTEGVNALIVSPGSPLEFADALDKLLGDVSLRQAFGTAGRSAAQASFTLDRSVRGILSIYDLTMASQRTARVS